MLILEHFLTIPKKSHHLTTRRRSELSPVRALLGLLRDLQIGINEY
jgi:hypothetical protein